MTISKQLEKFLDLNLDFDYLSLINNPDDKNITFIDEEKYSHHLKHNYCFKYVLIDSELQKIIGKKYSQNFITVEYPRLVYFQALNEINKELNSKKQSQKT